MIFIAYGYASRSKAKIIEFSFTPVLAMYLPSSEYAQRQTNWSVRRPPIVTHPSHLLPPFSYSPYRLLPPAEIGDNFSHRYIRPTVTSSGQPGHGLPRWLVVRWFGAELFFSPKYVNTHTSCGKKG